MTIYQQAVKKFGVKSQLLQTMEELAELIVANERLSASHTVENLDNFAEEVADVEIMFKQVEFIFETNIPLKGGFFDRLENVRLSEACALAIKALNKYMRGQGQNEFAQAVVSIQAIIARLPDYSLDKIKDHKIIKLERLARLLGD